MVINPFSEVLDMQREMSKKDVISYGGKRIHGTIISMSPLLVELEDGNVLPRSKFSLCHEARAKNVKCDATFAGNFSGTINGDVTINTPSGAITGFIVGNIELDGIFDGEFESEVFWGGIEVGDKVLLTSYNHNQQYLIHGKL